MERHEPRRRCVGCGRTAPKSALARIALARAGDGQSRLAVLDRTATMPGRGAYLCLDEASGAPAQACLALAGRRSAIPRALRSPVAIDPKLIESVNR